MENPKWSQYLPNIWHPSEQIIFNGFWSHPLDGNFTTAPLVNSKNIFSQTESSNFDVVRWRWLTEYKAVSCAQISEAKQ